jgi:hypothetical protein
MRNRVQTILAPRLPNQDAGVINRNINKTKRASAVLLLASTLLWTTQAKPESIPPTRAGNADPVARLAALASDVSVPAVLETNTPAMREAARIRADLQAMLAKIDSAVQTMRTANRASSSNYVADIDDLAKMIIEGARQVGDGGKLFQESGTLLQSLDKQIDEIKAKARKPQDPGRSWYEKLLPGLEADKTVLTSARGAASTCQADLIAEGKRLQSLREFIGTAMRCEQLHEAVNAFVAALEETSGFTSRLKASIDGLIRIPTGSAVAIE